MCLQYSSVDVSHLSDAYDPNYQTLAAVGAGNFGADKAAAPAAPAAAPAAAPPPAAVPAKDLPKAGENKIAGEDYGRVR